MTGFLRRVDEERWEAVYEVDGTRATGTLQGDSLRVQYNLIMQENDFEDAAYALMR